MAKVTRIKTSNFTILSNELVRDSELSWKARGIFGYIFSQPDDWQFFETELVNHSTDGRSATRSGIAELEKKGYLKRMRSRDEKGRLKTSEWIISDAPMFD
ncbi:hypothetical protein ACRHK7_01245 [Weissella tructae]|uniref:hypothetical protein n=1 Tax=Weissella tructae TaxID=887702 RepID=UPI003D92709F